MSVLSKGQAYFDVGIDFANAIVTQSVTVDSPHAEDKMYCYAMGYFLAKSCKTYQALSLLWLKGFEEDAMILNRSLFEIALQATYINGKPRRRGRKFCDFWDVAQYRHYENLRKLKDPRLEAFLQERKDDVRQLSEKYEQLKDRYPEDQATWWGGSVEWLAQTVREMGQGEFLLWRQRVGYPVECSFVHSSVSASVRYMKADGERKWLDYQPHPPTDVEVAQDATLNILKIVAECAKALNLNLNEALKNAAKEFLRIAGESSSSLDLDTESS
ncbi:MAG: hypothetical protein JXL80_11520 [Planctomycetes bacterium]|nr:hypothetical protein [Planctomycetota bacterium]